MSAARDRLDDLLVQRATEGLSASEALELVERTAEHNAREAEALETWRRGIAAAHEKGDRQAEKEMTVFARRLEKRLGGAS